MFRTLADIVIKLAALGFLFVCILVALMKAQIAPIEMIPGVELTEPPPIPARCGQIEDIAALDDGCRAAWLANRRHFLGQPPVSGKQPVLGKPIDGAPLP